MPGAVNDPGLSGQVVFMVTGAGTASTFLTGFVGSLVDHGWLVTVISSPGDRLNEMVENSGVAVRPLSMERGISPVRDLKSAFHVWRTLRDLNPQILLVATPKASLLGATVGRLVGVRVVVHLMWGLRSETLQGWRRRLVQLMERTSARLAHITVANSKSLAEEAVRMGIARADRIVVVGSGSSHGVEIAKFRRTQDLLDEVARVHARLDRVGPGQTIGFVGRLTNDKGIRELLAAFELIVDRGTRVRLILVGGVEDKSLLQRVEGMQHRGLPVLWLDRVADIAPYFHAMDIHCLPTYREGFPNVVLEASACGVATVTTDATGARDSVVDGVTGLIVPRANVWLLADALELLLSDKELRLRLGKNAASWASREFDSVVVWNRHENMLRQLLSVDRKRMNRRP